ncbi:MAG: hypothetical protein KatS3mg057_0881 [Herpetosiphonaceae bacterium]|nr:MAG: hypothetical protein KatS3mg057_0881 [Herpetosiphonaceae bacterium]
MSYLLPLGPFHPAWRGPLRLVLRVENEAVIDLEYKDGYNQRGVAERLTRVSLPKALQLVGRICGVDAQAHTLGFCLALEQLLGAAPPERATMLRTAVAELERAVAHLEALASVLSLMGLTRDSNTLSALRAGLLECQGTLCGAPLSSDYCLPLGVRQDLSADGREDLLLALRRFERNLYRFIDRFIDARGVLRRTVGIGCLSNEAARQYGLRGPLARAAGIASDVRSDAPYAGYERLEVRPIVQQRGDVYSRLVVLLLESLESANLLLQILSSLPEGDWMGNTLDEIPAGSATATVESSRGLLRYRLESDGRRLTAVTIDAPHQLDRLLVRTLLQGALVDDAALIVASTAPCMACAEG